MTSSIFPTIWPHFLIFSITEFSQTVIEKSEGIIKKKMETAFLAADLPSPYSPSQMEEATSDEGNAQIRI